MDIISFILFGIFAGSCGALGAELSKWIRKKWRVKREK